MRLCTYIQLTILYTLMKTSFMKPHQNGKYWTEGYVSLVLVLEATVDSASLGESWYLSAFLFQMEIVPGFLPEKIRFIINQRWFLLLRKNILRLRCKTITHLSCGSAGIPFFPDRWVYNGATLNWEPVSHLVKISKLNQLHSTISTTRKETMGNNFYISNSCLQKPQMLCCFRFCTLSNPVIKPTVTRLASVTESTFIMTS